MAEIRYDNRISELEDIIGYTFKNKDIIFAAVTHSSYANEKKSRKLKYNERLEFLGDSVLGLTISEYLFQKKPNLPEGELSVTRAKIVCENSLSQCATDIGLGKYLLLGKGEELSGGREKISLLSDAFEALIGALYIDGGFETAKSFIYRYMDKIIKSCIEGKLFYDYKTQLQELVQQNGEQQITYSVTDQFGPDHNKTFITEVKINGAIQGRGKGHSKKEAEQNAAKNALNNLKTN
ncbi:ribonuclease III [Ruminiclostridium cellulolyticum]|uniref:Ribonuclease 3 n=1 Tax=Ruminiclostridium cellulolyticum (strain ATCC 35319 / DSM 5812 / JCM 6584 / H10) TaxID=394503 RepID=B8I7R0_RUMCH|nr:ribonuclease III [Ruminiclostridium cellulolyticum]ACL75067.1 ribonuclease III [Ruminiclostridium cellulolyticum H10]